MAARRGHPSGVLRSTSDGRVSLEMVTLEEREHTVFEPQTFSLQKFRVFLFLVTIRRGSRSACWRFFGLGIELGRGKATA